MVTYTVKCMHCWDSDSEDLNIKRRVFHKVEGLRRLREEELILVREMKQHWEYITNQLVLREVASRGVVLVWQDDGCKGLQCLVQRQLAELRSFQHGVKQKYLSILTSADFSEPDNKEELHDSSEAEISSDEEE
ncbi:hypothetical protein AAFF_G00276980 [Aldrovandia affinis]|uniref:Uncharacterized protein n=1 Tax=Aldrovandia affinis TaxID=143900 RepID=A0AAD7RAI0_9TELE|nr:hypothetical protein AAFF_G00276980 [Aldrovandia affinis]